MIHYEYNKNTKIIKISMKKLCAIGLIALGARVTIYSQEIQTSFNVESKDEMRKSSCSDRKSVIRYFTQLRESPFEIMRSALLFKIPQEEAGTENQTTKVQEIKTISDLPNEIITKIFRYLDTKSKLQCAQASKKFKAIADSERSLVHAIDSESKDYMNQDFNFYRGPQLKRISIKGESLENINLTHLKLCENLEELTLADVNLTKKQFENLFSALPSLPHLEVLNLSGISVPTWGGLYLTRMQASNLENFLQKSSKLKTLKIPYLKVPRASAYIFRQLPSTLQDLDLEECGVMPHQVDGLLKGVTRCSGLTSLVLSENELYNYKYVEEFPELLSDNVAIFGLCYGKLSKQHASALLKALFPSFFKLLPTLQDQDCTSYRLMCGNEDFFRSLPQTLKILKLGFCRLNAHHTTALFKTLPSLKNLHTLDLSTNMLDQLPLDAFKGCFPQSLEKVDLSCCNITREQSEILLDTMSTLKKLQEVRLDVNRHINLESLQKLNNLPALKAIFVRSVSRDFELRERPAGIANNIEVYTENLFPS